MKHHPIQKRTPSLYDVRRGVSRIFAVTILPVLLLLLMPSVSCRAQVTTGNLSGQVMDASEAVVSGATVTANGVATGYQRSTKSGSDGSYLLADLPIGDYIVTVSNPGFTTLKQGVSVGVGERVRLDLHLTVGADNQTVQVSAQAVNLSRDDASISTLVTQDTIANTPLYLRNWDDLLRTVPGVQINRYTNQSGATSSGRTGSFNVNGVHSLQN